MAAGKKVTVKTFKHELEKYFVVLWILLFVIIRLVWQEKKNVIRVAV